MMNGDLDKNTTSTDATIVENGKNEKSIEKNKEEKSKPTSSITYLSLFRYSTPLDKIFTFVGLLASVASGVIFPGIMYLFGNITGIFVDYVTFMSSSNSTEAERDERTDVFMGDSLRVCLLMVALGVLIVILTYISNTLVHYSALRQIFRMRQLFLQSMLNQDIGWYDVHQTGDFASSLTDNLSKIEEGIGEKLAIFVFYKTVFIGGIVLALILGWQLALISLVSLPISTIAMGFVAWLTTKFAKKEMEAYASASSVAEEVLSAVRTVVSFDGQQKELERYEGFLNFARNNNIRRALFSAISNAMLWFFVFSCYSLSFWYGVGLIIDERGLPESGRVYTAGNVVAVFTISIMACWYFGMGAPYVEVFSVATGAAEKIYNILDSKPIINNSKGSGYKMKRVDGTITFKNVHFRYPSRKDVEVLQGLNLTINSGETVALVGSSGCGKSTIIQLIQRFYDPTLGEICLDGNNLKHFDLAWLREHVGVVGQEPILFATTIAENIRYGSRTATQMDVERAAQKANAHDFIICLPKGYNTVVGERGAQLSGGQKQRIAIARALIRHPKILLLDEATSALDTTSEAKVQATLDNASHGCTTVIVAHRLSTVRNAQRIVVLSDGKVVEQGTHEELIASQGAYYTLTMSQDTRLEEAVDVDELETTEVIAYHEDEIFERKRSRTFSDFVHHVEPEIEPTKKPGGFEVLLNVLDLNRPEWFLIILGCVSSIINGSMMPAYSLVFGDIIGVLAIQDADELRASSNIFCLYFLIIGIVAGTATFLQNYSFAIAGEKLTKRIRSLMFSSILKQEMGWFDLKENGVGALCTKLSAEAAKVQGASGQCIGSILSSTGTFTLSAALALYFEWRLALVALAFSPFIFISIYFEQKIVNDDGGGNQKTLEMSGKLAIEAISNIRTLASLGCEDSFYKLYVEHLIPHHESAKKRTHFRALILGAARGLMNFSYAVAMYYGAYLIVSTTLEYGIVFKVAETVIVGSWSIGNALAYTPNFQKGFTAAADIFQMLSRVPKIRNKKDASAYLWSKANVVYSSICFSYPTRPTARVLKGLNLSVLEGKTVALVGPSGCGKSTIVQLLERFYDPTFGAISVDDEIIQNIDLKALRSQLGIVSQEPNLFDRSIAENIAYGANDRIVPIDEVIEAAKMANIHDFVASLPLGYETKLGDRGTQLSGGQKQRVAIARALVRNPKVLLLDEATSALDNESEKVVQAALDNAKMGRTCITIAHRLTTIQDADLICVVADGRVAESGSHSELIAKRGLYYNLYTLQSNRL